MARDLLLMISSAWVYSVDGWRGVGIVIVLCLLWEMVFSRKKDWEPYK